MEKLIKELEKHVFKIDSLEELENQLNINDLYNSDYLIYSDIDLNAIVEALQYNGLSDDEIINRIKNDGFGYSMYELYYAIDDDFYILTNNMI